MVPNAELFGCLIEWGETLAGLGLVTAGLVALLRPLTSRYLGETPAAMFASGSSRGWHLLPRLPRDYSVSATSSWMADLRRGLSPALPSAVRLTPGFSWLPQAWPSW